MSVSGAAGNGTSTYLSQHQGPGCADKAMNQTLISTFTLTRENGDGYDLPHPDGTWTLTGTRPQDVGHFTIANGQVTGDYANRPGYTFSANTSGASATGADTNGATVSGAQTP